jgi:hypothetical protein
MQGTLTATSTCDRCKSEIQSQGMVYWLIEISNRPTLDRGDIAIGSPKYCKLCAHQVEVEGGPSRRDQIGLIGR